MCQSKNRRTVHIHDIITLSNSVFAKRLLLRPCSYRVHLNGICNYQLVLAYVDIICCDISKASDIISLRKLLCKHRYLWQHLEPVEVVLIWKNFCVMVNSSYSNERNGLSVFHTVAYWVQFYSICIVPFFCSQAVNVCGRYEKVCMLCNKQEEGINENLQLAAYKLITSISSIFSENVRYVSWSIHPKGTLSVKSGIQVQNLALFLFFL